MCNRNWCRDIAEDCWADGNSERFECAGDWIAMWTRGPFDGQPFHNGDNRDYACCSPDAWQGYLLGTHQANGDPTIGTATATATATATNETGKICQPSS